MSTGLSLHLFVCIMLDWGGVQYFLPKFGDWPDLFLEICDFNFTDHVIFGDWRLQVFIFGYCRCPFLFLEID